jgi:hypothetical protein
VVLFGTGSGDIGIVVGKGGGMRRHRAGNDLLGTMERCLAAVRDRADAAGVTMELAVPVDPALLRADTTPLAQLGRHLLCYAIGHAMPGDRLLVRIDVTADGTITLAIDEECGGADPRCKAPQAAGRGHR